MELKYEFKMCRLCLGTNKKYIEIFHMNEWFDYVAGEVITDLLRFEISEDDIYPNIVCSICLRMLTDFKDFKEQCIVSKDLYDNVFASAALRQEVPMDIVEGPVKLEPKDSSDTQKSQQEADLDPKGSEAGRTSTVELSPQEDLDPVNLEVEDTITDDIHAQEDLDSVNLTPEETKTDDIPAQVGVNSGKLKAVGNMTVGIHAQIRKCTIACTSLDYAAYLRKRAQSESHKIYKNTINDVNSDGNPSLNKRKMEVVDNNSCENIKKSGSAAVKFLKMDIKVRKDRISPGDGIRMLPIEKINAKRAESSIGELKRRKGVHAVDVDTTLGDDAKLISKQASDNDAEGGSERERDEEAILRVNEKKIIHFRCHDCGKEFERKDVLIRHLGVHGYQVYGKSINEEGDLQGNISVNCGNKHNTNGLKRKRSKNVKKVERVNRYICDKCGKGYKWKCEIKVHVRTHSGVKPYGCDVCGKHFTQKVHLTFHSRVHTGEKPYACQICGRLFSKKSSCKSHMSIHTGEKPYKCLICGKAFGEHSNLSHHKKIHSGVKKYECEVCGRKFTLNSTLKTHMRLHSGEKPYKCDACDKAFCQRNVLITHRKVHKVKPYKCDMCNKAFAQNCDLINHSKTHKGENPYKCEACDKKFSDKSNLDTHRQILCSGKQHKCESCGKTFANKFKLKQHAKIHNGKKPYTCNVCNKCFSNKSNLNRHLILHSREKPC